MNYQDKIKALVEAGNAMRRTMYSRDSSESRRWDAAVAEVKLVGRPRVSTREDAQLAAATLTVNGKRPSLREVARELRVSKSTVARLLK
jgi:hypothetical protein